MTDSAAAAAAAPTLPATASSGAVSVSSSTAAAAPSNRRLEKTTVCLPIVYGSIAFYLGKKADEYQTHQWTLYLRGANGEDLSLVISKVVFQLHPSFAQPTRELTEPPYEVTERGWGEFEAQIRIVWKDPTEKSTVVAHGIKLYPPGTPMNSIPTETTSEPVVAESYDEVVFTDPSESFYGQLRRLSSSTVPVELQYSQQAHFGKFSDTDDAKAMLEAQKFLQTELQKVKERMKLVDSDLAQVDGALRQVQEQQQAQAQQKRKASPSRAAASKARSAAAASAATSSAKKARTS